MPDVAKAPPVKAAPKKEPEAKPDLVWLSVVDPADPQVLGKRVLVNPSAVSLLEETPPGVPYSVVMVGGAGILARGDVSSIARSLGLVVKA